MPTDTPVSDSTTASAAGPNVASASATIPSRQADSYEVWGYAVAGICVAGATYPTVAFGLFWAGEVVAEAVRYFAGLPSETDVVEDLVIIVMLPFATVAGLALAGVATLVATPLFYLFRSLRLRISSLWSGAILGGLVGFVAVLSAVPVLLLATGADGFPVLLATAALGPGLTTVLGQAGGAWGGWRGTRIQRLRRALAAAAADVGITTPPADELTAPRTPRFQFRLRQLLWLNVWLSLLFAGAAASGEPLVVLTVVGVWLVYQAATLYLGAKLVRRLGRCVAARRARREQAALATAGD